MSEAPESTAYIEYGTRPFIAILLSLFLAGFAVFSSLYCVQPMMPFLASFFMLRQPIVVSRFHFPPLP